MNRFEPGNAIDLLRSGGEYFPALCAAIDAAAREVWLETYIFADDSAGTQDRDLVAAGRAAGDEHLHAALGDEVHRAVGVALRDEQRAAAHLVRSPIGREHAPRDARGAGAAGSSANSVISAWPAGSAPRGRKFWGWKGVAASTGGMASGRSIASCQGRPWAFTPLVRISPPTSTM